MNMEDLVLLLLYIAGLCGLLSVVGFVADYILPLIPPLERWIESLPMMEDDEEGENEHEF